MELSSQKDSIYYSQNSQSPTQKSTHPAMPVKTCYKQAVVLFVHKQGK